MNRHNGPGLHFGVNQNQMTTPLPVLDEPTRLSAPITWRAVNAGKFDIRRRRSLCPETTVFLRVGFLRALKGFPNTVQWLP